MTDPIQGITGQPGPFEELTKNRQGNEVDIAIAIKDSKLTDQEISTLLKKSGLLEKFTALNPTTKDYVSRLLLFYWSLNRISESIINSDGQIIKLLGNNNQLTAALSSLESYVSGWLETALTFLFSMLESDVKVKTVDPRELNREVIGRLVKYFDSSQIEYSNTASNLSGVTGIEGFKKYLNDYRSLSISKMREIETNLSIQLNKILERLSEDHQPE